MIELSTSLVKISHILNDLQYHDEHEISLQLGITIDAVYLYIKKLKEYGVNIEIKNKAYAFKERLFLLNRQFIAQEINNSNKAKMRCVFCRKTQDLVWETLPIRTGFLMF